ncbi:hypothetical protein ACQ86N_33175 [Puia sp. P3]|uniref:hypothetical protein n=1 Tax=Puia sp. P3 TaxID=3423952 RepID=UPI003D669114
MKLVRTGVKSYFNFANAVEGRRDISEELRTLGKGQDLSDTLYEYEWGVAAE